ncbi:MAG TPA: 4'-phosphopantetheinyl transferase superfamily protein [Thermoanaerobaculia bacterium]|nr:4'-phosphopantetheinyl transferase superfamily protein [Thermoanaerobaculia bacterium]
MTDFPPRPLPPRLDLAAGEVQIWSIPLDPPAAEVERLTRLLSADEHERARRFRFDVHRRRYIVGRGALRRLLGAYLGADPAGLRFGYGPRGKPELPDGRGLGFNLSNSEDLALAGFLRDREIGVDVEYLKEMDDFESIATRFFSPSEVAALAQVPRERKKEAFFNCWTRKEAYLKAVGEGLAAPLNSFDVTLTPGEPPRMLTLEGSALRAAPWFFHHLRPAPGFIGAIAVPGGTWEVRGMGYVGYA